MDEATAGVALADLRGVPDQHELAEHQRLDRCQAVRRVADALPPQDRGFVENECRKADIEVSGYDQELTQFFADFMGDGYGRRGSAGHGFRHPGPPGEVNGGFSEARSARRFTPPPRFPKLTALKSDGAPRQVYGRLRLAQ